MALRPWFLSAFKGKGGFLFKGHKPFPWKKNVEKNVEKLRWGRGQSERLDLTQDCPWGSKIKNMPNFISFQPCSKRSGDNSFVQHCEWGPLGEVGWWHVAHVPVLIIAVFSLCELRNHIERERMWGIDCFRPQWLGMIEKAGGWRATFGRYPARPLCRRSRSSLTFTF